MMDNVLTLVTDPATAGVTENDAMVAVRTLTGAGATGAGAAVWLASGVACDLPFSGLAPTDAAAAVRRAFDGRPVDVVAQPISGRRKSLLIADMESTIIENEMLDELAAAVGIGDRIADITARAMAGELDFETALRERVGMLEGLDASTLERSLDAIRITPGARVLVATMAAHGAYCALVSGGFSFFTNRVRDRIGFDYDQSNRLEIKDGKLTGHVIEPILGRDAKREALLRLTAEQNIPTDAAIAVGDGANDLAMLETAGLGVAFRAKPIVAARARARIDHSDLTALLYLQGYRQEEFRG